jgi:uncharacterized membrane protein
MKLLRPALAAVLLLGLAACSRVTADNYDRLQTGMTRAEVHALLGAPDKVSGGGIGRSVTYAGEKLAIKSIESRQD